MWNDNDIFANDIAEKFEQRMFCNFGGGGDSRDDVDTGGYDPLGAGTVDDPTSGGGQNFSSGTLEDISGGDSDDQAYVDAIRQNVKRQVELSQDYRDLVDQGRNIDYQNYFDLARRSGIIPSQFGSGGGLKDYVTPALSILGIPNFSAMGKFIGQNASRQLMEGLQKGYKPQYNAIGQIVATYDPETGRYGAGSVKSRIDPNDPRNQPIDIFSEDNSDPDISESTAVAVIEEPEPELSMIDMDYRYPAGGIYPEEGLYRRMGLLDIAPTQYGGLLTGYDQPQFAEMNVGFRRPTDVSLFQDPYDVTGYSLI